jgi:hypothetical protein
MALSLSRTSTLVTIASTIVGSLLAYFAFAASVSWWPFQDKPHGDQGRVVSVYKAGPASGVGNCHDVSCAYIGVELKGFAPNTSVRCSFDSSVGPSVFRDYISTTDDRGFLRGQSDNYFGVQRGYVVALCDGVRGELNPW